MATIRTLLLSGANNHDWTRSSPFLRDLLEGSGKFAVTLTENPSASLEDVEALKGYRLIFSDYNGPAWSEAAKANFVAAIEGGTGLVVLHAADNAFPGWVEYETMVALLWRQGTGHGQYHEFEVKITDKDHPVTRGLEDFRLWDELYHRLVHMHDAPYHVLATAYSDPKTGGTGKDEPMMTVQQYGKGRVYHHVMGHVWPGDPAANKGCSMMTFENPMFQKSLLRGCEWAATGDVAE
ncbi:MAG TPA: ThuA domain-containing protein [Planctomycetota bacterium]|nr:ThuA domain-containing protein [Planctomycetota bacterium]